MAEVIGNIITVTLLLVKYGKLNHVHQVADDFAESWLTSTPSGHASIGFSSCGALTTQLSELVQKLHTATPTSSTPT